MAYTNDSKSFAERLAGSSPASGTENNMIRRYKPRKLLFFDWSPELAYAVGLLVTDGCLSSNKKNIIFTSKDIEQIGNIKRIINLPGKIGFTRNKRSEAYRLQFSSVQLWDWLYSIGLTPHKSLTIGSINIPDEYFIDAHIKVRQKLIVEIA